MMTVNIFVLCFTLLSQGWGNNFLLEMHPTTANNTDLLTEDGEDYEEDYESNIDPSLGCQEKGGIHFQQNYYFLISRV